MESNLENFAKFSNCQYALRLANGTAALIAAYKSLNLKIGDELITTPRSFASYVFCCCRNRT